MKKIEFTGFNHREAARYLGYGNNLPEGVVAGMMEECESEITKNITPSYVYKVFDVESKEAGVYVRDADFLLKGEDIKKHLSGCDRAIFMCVTLSQGMDRLIKKYSHIDMTRAVIMDAMASVAVENICDSIENKVKKEFEGYYFTYRFGIGYGDLPLEQLGDFLKILDASKYAGVSVTSGGMMTPTKSVACIIGISANEIKSKRRGCISCNMKESCKYRIRGERCGF